MKTLWNFLKSRFLWLNILAAIVLVVVICWIVFWRLDVYTRHGEAVEVPNLSGMYVEEAELILKDCGLGDHRGIVAAGQDFAKAAPVSLLMVADMDKFGSKGQHAQWMVAVDTGIVTENINIFCSAAGLATVTRGTMDQKAISTLLGLNENQIPLINNPVGYMK